MQAILGWDGDGDWRYDIEMQKKASFDEFSKALNDIS